MVVIALVAVLILALQWFAADWLETYRIVLPDAGRFLGFFIGVAVAYVESDMKQFILRQENKIRIASLLALTCIPFIQLLWTYKVEMIQDYTPWRNSYFITTSLCFGVLLLSLISFKGVLNRIFEFKPLRILGQISYSFYLTHALLGIPLSLSIVHTVDTFPKMVLHYFFSITMSFLLATFIYYYLERPYFVRLNRVCKSP